MTGSVDLVILFMAAHEVRDPDERLSFFTELHRILKPSGRIVVTEHLQDLPNFLVYTIGFFHFYPHSTWQETFQDAGLRVTEEQKQTPFISTFILEKT